MKSALSCRRPSAEPDSPGNNPLSDASAGWDVIVLSDARVLRPWPGESTHARQVRGQDETGDRP